MVRVWGFSLGFRIAILHQGFVPTYRKRFFELLSEQGNNNYVVFHGQPPSNTGHVEAPGPLDFPNVRVRNLELRLGKRVLLYQPVLWKVLFGGFDAIVVGHECKLLAGQILFAAYKLTGKPAILWGHGQHRDNAHPLARSCAGRTALLTDGYLVYTPGGAERLRRAGLSPELIFVLRNTIDLADQISAHERLKGVSQNEIKREFGLNPNAQTLLYIGRVYGRKRCDQLITLMHRLNADLGSEAVDLAIVGVGPDLEAIRESAADLPNVHFLGEIYDTQKVAKLMHIASAMINPGSVGLAVNHCFAHGVPVITREDDLHSPEVDYIRDGQNGFLVAGGMDEFVTTVHRVLAEPDLLRRLSSGALATRDSLGLDNMVKEFDRGVSRCIERRRRPRKTADLTV